MVMESKTFIVRQSFTATTGALHRRSVYHAAFFDGWLFTGQPDHSA